MGHCSRRPHCGPFVGPGTRKASLFSHVSGTSAEGTIAGSWGGTPVQGTYSDALWATVSGGKVVLGGTYHCNSGCAFNGTVSYWGVSTAVLLLAKTLGDTERTETVAGDLSINLPRLIL